MDAIERIYREWHERAGNNDTAGLLALYSAGATFESPLVPRLMKTGRGIVRGQDELRAFFEQLARNTPSARDAGRGADGPPPARLLGLVPPRRRSAVTLGHG